MGNGITKKQESREEMVRKEADKLVQDYNLYYTVRGLKNDVTGKMQWTKISTMEELKTARERNDAKGDIIFGKRNYDGNILSYDQSNNKPVRAPNPEKISEQAERNVDAKLESEKDGVKPAAAPVQVRVQNHQKEGGLSEYKPLEEKKSDGSEYREANFEKDYKDVRKLLKPSEQGLIGGFIGGTKISMHSDIIETVMRESFERAKGATPVEKWVNAVEIANNDKRLKVADVSLDIDRKGLEKYYRKP